MTAAQPQRRWRRRRQTMHIAHQRRRRQLQRRLTDPKASNTQIGGIWCSADKLGSERSSMHQRYEGTADMVVTDCTSLDRTNLVNDKRRKAKRR